MGNMYVIINRSDEDADIAIVFAESFTEAISIYGKERSEDYITQSIYYYGMFEDPEPSDPDSCTPEYAKENLDRHNKSWQIGDKKPISVIDFGGIYKSRVYKGDYHNTITVTELPIEKYQVVSHIIFGGIYKVLDRVQIMKTAEEELKRIQSIDIEKELGKEKVNEACFNESWKVTDLLRERSKARDEMLEYPSDSNEYKKAKKKYEDIKKEINSLLSDNDEVLIKFTEEEE